LESYWTPVTQLLAVGVLKTALYQELLKKIDDLARQEDRANREAAGLPVNDNYETI
jgi:hypothetical protein